MKACLAAAAALVALAVAGQAAAHNQAHHFAGNGRCIEVGAGNSPADQGVFHSDKVKSTVPQPGADGTWSRDEFGTRWVADPTHPNADRNEPFLRGACPA